MVINRRSATVAMLLAVAGAAALLAFVPTAALAAQCTRVPLSDVAFGKAAATDAARVKLRQYAMDVAAKRGWNTSRGMSKSNETVSCEVYLNLGPLGTEYRCLVTATFCVK